MLAPWIDIMRQYMQSPYWRQGLITPCNPLKLLVSLEMKIALKKNDKSVGCSP